VQFSNSPVGVEPIIISSSNIQQMVTYSDTGANADLVPLRIAMRLEEMGVVQIEWVTEGAQVAFGNSNNKEKIIGKIRGAGLLQRVDVVQGLRDTLIGGRGFVERGMELLYNSTGVYLLHDGDKRVQLGVYNQHQGLWQMDLVRLLQMQDPRGVRAFRTNITRKTRVSARDMALCVELHESLLHIIPYETMAATIESGAWGNVHPSITPQLCRAIAKRRDCAICALTWNTPRAVGTGTAVEEIGAYFAFDNEGKMKTPSMGCHFSSTFMDLGCGFTKVYGLKKKTAIIDAIRAWVIEMLSYKRIPRGGRCDAGSVETGKEFQEAMGVLGLDVIPNPSKEPEHSVERKWQTTHNGTVKVLATVDAFTTADWLTSQTTSSNVNNTVPNARSRRHDPSKSPLELMTGRKVDMTMIQTLQVGDVCVVAHKKGRAMGRPRNVLARVMDVDLDGGRCALLKYMDDSQRVERKAGMMPVADIETGPIASRLRSRTVTMAPDEHGELIISIAGRTDSADTLRSLTLRQQQERQEDEAREDTLIERIQGAQQGGEQLLDVNRLPEREAAEENDEYPYWQPVFDDQGEAEQEAVAFWAKYIDVRANPFREVEEISAHMAYREGCGEYAAIEIFPEERATLQAYKARVTRTDDNPSIYMIEKAGRGSPLWTRWEKPLLKEYNGITDKDAWEDATPTEIREHGFTPHVTTLTVKRTTNEDKARITTNGKAEKATGIFPGKEFLFTPAMDEVILRFMGAIKAYFNLRRLRRSDVSQCFQYNRMADARLPRTVIVNLRPIEWGGYHRKAKKMLAVGYGMADAGREWFITIVAFLVDQGFAQCPEAECMFVKRVGSQGFILIGLATDDIQHLATEDELTQAADRELECELSKRWKMVHEDAHDVLGVTIVTSEDGTVTMRQGPQLRKIQQHFLPKGRGTDGAGTRTTRVNNGKAGG
jgi:hypothetical protein